MQQPVCFHLLTFNLFQRVKELEGENETLNEKIEALKASTVSDFWCCRLSRTGFPTVRDLYVRRVMATWQSPCVSIGVAVKKLNVRVTRLHSLNWPSFMFLGWCGLWKHIVKRADRGPGTKWCMQFFIFSVIVHVMDKQGRNPFSVGQKNCFNNESFYELVGLSGYITIRRFLQMQ